MNNNDLVAHPLAEHFPLVAGADYDRLRTAIRVSGQQEAIVLYEGRILSGRARYKICRDLQRQPLLTEWTDEMGPALEKVIKDNIAARELSKPTRAAIAAGLMSKDEKEIDKTLAHFGRMFNVSPHSIRYAGVILKQGTDRERELLAAGKLSISPVAIDIIRGVDANERAKVRRLATGRRIPMRVAPKPVELPPPSKPEAPRRKPRVLRVVPPTPPEDKPPEALPEAPAAAPVVVAASPAPVVHANGFVPHMPHTLLQQALWTLIAGTAALDPGEALKHHVIAGETDIDKLAYWLMEYAEQLRKS